MAPIPRSDKRKYLRHPFSIPIKLEMPAEPQTGVSESTDISQGGLSFLWNTSLSRGSRLHITIPVKEKRFELNARVAYSHEDAVHPRLFRTGVKFTDIDSAFKAKLAEETLEILSYQKRLSREAGRDVPVEEAAKEWISKYAANFSSFTG